MIGKGSAIPWAIIAQHVCQPIATFPYVAMLVWNFSILPKCSSLCDGIPTGYEKTHSNFNAQLSATECGKTLSNFSMQLSVRECEKRIPTLVYVYMLDSAKKPHSTFTVQISAGDCENALPF